MAKASSPDGLLTPLDQNRQQTWGIADAAHLLRRLQFGYTPEELDQAAKRGADETLERLLNRQQESAEFQNADSALKATALATGEINDLKIWWLYRMWASANPLTEKMSLLWHNHFATSFDKVRSVEQMLNQNELIRRHALGNFKPLLHGMSRDPAMLVWLDGNANRKRHPNENFAREIMELFALGVGNYTEKDIQEAARAFSGWQVRDGAFWLNQSQHDQTQKTVFGTSGDFDGAAIVDLCLAQPSCPRFLATKLLKTFVIPNPAEDMIHAVASRVQVHEFDLQPILRELCSSQMFYDSANRRTLIKSPMDLVIGSLRSLANKVKWPSIVRFLAQMGQDLFQPPSVKGWEGNRLWINSSTVLHRINFATELTSTDRLASLRSDILSNVEGAHDATVTQQERLLLGGEIDNRLHVRLVETYQQFEGPPAQKANATLQLVMSLPEYQLY